MAAGAGEILPASAEYPSADVIAIAQRATQTLREHPSRDRLDFASALEAQADLLYRRQQFVRAHALFDTAIAIRGNGAGPPAVLASRLRARARLGISMCDFAGAARDLERVAAIETKLRRQDPETQVQLMRIAVARGDSAGAAAAFARFRAMVTTSDTTSEARACFLAGWTLHHLDHDLRGTALPFLEVALAYAPKMPRSRRADPGATRYELAEGHAALEHHEYALALCDTALRAREAAFGRSSIEAARSVAQRGRILAALSDPAAARAAFERAAPVLERNLGRDHTELLRLFDALGASLVAMGDLDRARSTFRHTIEAVEAGYGSADPGRVASLAGLMKADEVAGDEQGAMALAKQARDLIRRTYGPAHPAALPFEVRIARDLAARDPRAARAALVAVRALAENALTPGSPGQAAALAGYSSVSMAVDDPVAAREALERSLAIEERLRGADDTRLWAVARDLAEACARAGELDLARTHAARSLGLAERGFGAAHANTIAALDRLAAVDAARGDLAPAIDAALRSAELGRARWNETGATASERDLARAAAGCQPTAGVRVALALKTADRSAAARLWESLIEERSRAFDELAVRHRSARDARAGTRLADLVRELPVNGALVGWYRCDRFDGFTRSGVHATPAYAAFVLRAGESGPAVVATGTAASVDSLVARWRAEIERGARVPARFLKENGYRAAATALRHVVWDPVAAELAGVTQVFVVLDGALERVPLGTLTLEDGTYLIESGPAIHRLTHERDLIAVGARAGTGLLALGAPDFEHPSGSAIAGAEGGGETSRFHGALPACEAMQSLRWEPVAGAEEECLAVGATWRAACGRDDAHVHEGPFASEAVFKSQAPRHRVLHLAAPAFLPGGPCGADANPLRLAGLALAGANRRAAAKPSEEDGMLTAEEIASLDLGGVDWAVLTACAAPADGGGTSGMTVLRRAFRLAGARTVIANEWSLGEQGARRWIEALYTARLRDGLPTSDAVREASLMVLRERREKKQSTHPWLWGGFVASGEWR